MGAECSTNADCAQPLFCLTTDSNQISGEGPPGGICTLDCTSDPGACAKVDAIGFCVALSTTSTRNYCVPGCLVGPPQPGDDKCRSRPDVACEEDPTNPGIGYCVPTCRGDTDCGSRACDTATGYCTSVAPKGAGAGAACTSDANCAGFCAGFTPDYLFCTGFCDYGQPGCGQGQPYDSFCLLDDGTGPTPSDLGDLGLCAKLCDCDKDCGRADAMCTALPAHWRSTTGRAGYCVPKAAADAGGPTGIACK
jgi:hypothetical protein